MWSPNDPEVKNDWSAAIIEDLSDAERTALRSEPVEPKSLAAVSKRLAECCICRAERRRGEIIERIRCKPNRTKLFQQLGDNEISALAADIVDRALDVVTPEEAELLADVRIEDLGPTAWGIVEAIYDPERDIIRVGGATGTESLGHEAVHRAAEMLRERLLPEALSIGERADRTSTLVRSALETAERIAPFDEVITLQHWTDIHVDVISSIPHAQRPEVLCALAVWANSHPSSEAATWRFVTEYWAHRAGREPDVKRDILRRAIDSGVHLPRRDAWVFRSSSTDSDRPSDTSLH
jgi:hypothetical protein